MDETTYALLRACDSATELEEPVGFDREAALSGVRALQEDVNTTTGIVMQLDKSFQDASIFAALVEGASSSALVIRFSTFGNLVTANRNTRFDDPLSSGGVSEKITKLIEGHGYTYIQVEKLLEPYVGLCKPLIHQWTYFRRFFDHI